MLDIGYKQNKTFGIKVIVRDSEGNPIGTREYEHDNPYKIWEFWQRNRGKPKKKKRKKEKVPAGKRAIQLMESVAEYAEKKQQKRKSNNGE